MDETQDASEFSSFPIIFVGEWVGGSGDTEGIRDQTLTIPFYSLASHFLL